jgi:transposase
MDFLQHLLPSQTTLSLTRWQMDSVNHQITFNLSSRQAVALCPLCHVPSHRRHSRYERTLKDLPFVQFTLTILLQVGKFFCLNADCPRRIFTERLPNIIEPWARRTARYTEHLQSMGLALGGSAAARLSHQLGYGHSRNSFLRVISSLSLPEIATPRILGVDDFALRKGHQYGTILVDLEEHKPIALLPDRTAETLSAWLKAHPGVEILSRDRSKTYKRGMNEGAPEAIQVADRFHLLQNLEETLENVFKGKAQVLKAVEQDQCRAAAPICAEPLKPKTTRQQQKDLKRSQRLDNHEKVHALREQGHQIKDIAYHLGMGKRTVYTYLSHPTFPEWQPSIQRRRRGSQLDAYKPYLQEQWHQGRQFTKGLFEEIQQQGYRGTYASVSQYTRKLRQSQAQTRPEPSSLNELPGRGPAPHQALSSSKPLSARRAAWLVLQRTDTLEAEQEKLLAQLCEQPELADAISMTQNFLNLVRQRLPEQLDSWIEKAKSSSIKAFQSFAKGLTEDYEAVKAGVTLEISNGQVEGQNNRLKMLKRQMFGRAGLDLLAKRFILKG